MAVSSRFTLQAINSWTASRKPFAYQLGYWIRMNLSFKLNVTCRLTRNLWIVNVFWTFKRQNSVVKIGSWSGLSGGRGPCHYTTDTMVNLALVPSTVTERESSGHLNFCGQDLEGWDDGCCFRCIDSRSTGLEWFNLHRQYPAGTRGCRPRRSSLSAPSHVPCPTDLWAVYIFLLYLVAYSLACQ